MKIRVIDFTTTGHPEDKVKGICEVGWTDVLDNSSIGEHGSFFVNPGHPIPPQARAVHHISDADVAGAVPPDIACATLMNGMELGDVFAAHNAEFEQTFFPGGGLPWICTMKCAKHLFPMAPGYSNQILRYWLDVDDNGSNFHDVLPPHRAGPDSLVTAFVLVRLICVSSVPQLIKLTTTPALLDTVSFGK